MLTLLMYGACKYMDQSHAHMNNKITELERAIIDIWQLYVSGCVWCGGTWS